MALEKWRERDLTVVSRWKRPDDAGRFPPMRDQDEVQRAHDLLVAVLLGEVPGLVDQKDEALIAAQADVLCWVLNHAHNETFGGNLAKLVRAAERRGYELREDPR